MVELLYDIIPRKLRTDHRTYGVAKLVAIWHYLLIGTAIVVAMALIYLFAEALLARELLQRRIAKGLCQAWPATAARQPALPGLREAQFRACGNCNALTHVHGRYCKACGFDAQSG